MKRLITLLLTLVVATSTSWGQTVEPDSVRQDAWLQFRIQHNPNWKVEWNERTRLPNMVWGSQTRRAYAGPPLTAAFTFLEEHRALFGMQPGLPDLELDEVSSVRGRHHVRLKQTWKGLPVEEADYMVHVREDGRVVLAGGTYYADIQAPTSAQISEAIARKVAVDDLGGRVDLRREESIQLVIYPTPDAFHLAWKLLLPAAEPFGDWLYYIDAVSGAIISKHDQFMHVTGEGDVYPTYPGHSSVDDRDLYRLDGTGFLEGEYVTVINDEDDEAESQNHEFFYSTSSTHFDEVNVYYHVDTYRANFINNLGFSGFTEATAYVHDNYDPCNAGYSPGTTNIYFGDADGCPSGLQNFAWEDKVVYHEYTHAVTYHLNSGIFSTNDEEGGISEGTADYFAGSFADYRSSIGDWALPSSEVRDMADPELDSYSEYLDERNNEFPYGEVEAHLGGDFFAAILWDLRGAAGINAGEVDYLVYATLDGVDATPTFYEFRNVMVSEDATAYSGDHECIIKEVFADWGVGTECVSPPAAPTNLDVSGDFGEHPYLTWNASTGANEYYVYRCLSATYYCTTSYSFIDYTFSTNYTDTSRDVEDNCGFTFYRVTAVNLGGESSPSSSVTTCTEASKGGPPDVPADYALYSNYPNPFNPMTDIAFALPEVVHVRLVVYDMVGREVTVLVNEPMEAGYQRVTWDAANLPTGVYIYRLEAGDFSASGRMVLMK